MLSDLSTLCVGGLLRGHFAHYRTVQELRRGGMGVVVLANVESLIAVDSVAQADHGSELQQVVIKISLRADDHARGRMAQEITALQALQHPQVVSVVDHGTEQGHAWYAMDYVGPCNLGDVLLVRGQGSPSDLPSIVVGILDGNLGVIPRSQRIGLPVASVVALMIQVAQTVAHAHHRGVLHRDLKPANILLDDSGAPVLCDFGVARAQGFDANLTAVDEVVGTLDYIAPEQLAGSKPDERSDCYAMGAMLHECLTGQLPPRRRHGNDPLPCLRGLPGPLIAIIDYCLHPDPERRMRSASALAADLLRFQQGQEVRSPRRSRFASMLRIASRRPMLSGFLAVISLALILIIWVLHDQQLIRTAQWQSADVYLRGVQLIDLYGDDIWGPAPHGREGVVAGYPATDFPLSQSRHLALSYRVPAHSGQRVVIEADSHGAEQEITIFMTPNPEVWDAGYVFQLGAYDNTCSLLRRGNEILWMGNIRIKPNRRKELILEREDDILRVFLNRRLLVEQRDLAPVAARAVGFATYLYGDYSYEHPIVFRRLWAQAQQIPALVPVDWKLLAFSLSSGAEAVDQDTHRFIARAGAAEAQATHQRLADNDQRRPMLLLRSERLRWKLDRNPQREQDLGSLRDSLRHLAEFHLHQLGLRGAHEATQLQILRDARTELSDNEQARLALGSEHELTVAAWLPLLPEILRLSQSRPLEYDYILWRGSQMSAGTKRDFLKGWELIHELAARQSGSFWSRQAAHDLHFYEIFSRLREGRGIFSESNFASTPWLARIWREVLAGASWEDTARAHLPGPGAQEQAGVLVGALHDDFSRAKNQELHPPRLRLVDSEKWYRYDSLLHFQYSGPMIAPWELWCRHIAVAILLGEETENLYYAIPYLWTFPHSAVRLHVALAAGLRGIAPATIFEDTLAGDSPQLVLLRALMAEEEALPPLPELRGGVTPLVYLASARHLHQQGASAEARALLRALIDTHAVWPEAQAAAIILERGWP